MRTQVYCKTKRPAVASFPNAYGSQVGTGKATCATRPCMGGIMMNRHEHQRWTEHISVMSNHA